MSETADGIAENIQAAIDKYLAENGGGMVTGWTCAVDYFDSDGERSWALATFDSQTPSQTLGMLRWHTLNAEHDINAYFDREADE